MDNYFIKVSFHSFVVTLNMMSITTPIIVAFPLSGHFLQEVIMVNKQCDCTIGIDFSSQIPHLTLWMGFVKDLNYLVLEHTKIFKSIHLELKTKGQEIFSGVSGDVLSLNIMNTRELSIIQNRIHHFFEPYRCEVDAYEGFNKGTIDYLNNFHKKSLHHYDPHITVGFSSKKFTIETKTFQVSNPRIFLMGNNCTCIEVIDT